MTTDTTERGELFAENRSCCSKTVVLAVLIW